MFGWKGCLAAAGVLVFVVKPVTAATLTNVPMQGGMVMPMVSYSSSDARVHVMMPMTVPQLTPLLVSHPSDSFDPAHPWFGSLDPSAQGMAFSKRYGFMMDASDPLPENTAMWIRKVSGSGGLEAYRQLAYPPTWEPIFGTAGSSNALYWNGVMFHPAFAAPAGTNGYTATLEIYLVNTNTMEEVANSGSGPLVFHWTCVPDGRPSLDAALKFVVSWSTSVVNWAVESASSPMATNWTAVTNVPLVLDGQATTVLPPEGAAQVYRMRRLP
jgi:hypothetical protein